MYDSILIPMFGHLFWVATLYVALTLLRAPRVWGVDVGKNGANLSETLEPKVSANLSNQFELPIFFYVICVLVIVTGSTSYLYSGLAWLFILGRLVHSCVQIFTNNIRLRGLVFTINFIAVISMWCVFLYDKTSTI